MNALMRNPKCGNILILLTGKISNIAGPSEIELNDDLEPLGVKREKQQLTMLSLGDT